VQFGEQPLAERHRQLYQPIEVVLLVINPAMFHVAGGSVRRQQSAEQDRDDNLTHLDRMLPQQVMYLLYQRVHLRRVDIIIVQGRVFPSCVG